jgi:hypothetical protein
MTPRRLDFVQGAAETYSRFADNRFSGVETAAPLHGFLFVAT